jgi:Heterodisulfide reductase, subunit C
MSKYEYVEIRPEVYIKIRDFMKKLGADDFIKCFNCGTCTVACPIAEVLGLMPFSRKIIRYIMLGLEEDLVNSKEILLCLHCGECSEYCPKGANPAETMHALKTYIIQNYLLKR